MIKVLVVDDDKLARRGIVASMPWTMFHMEVAGEAKNGEEALAFLERHEVDLLLTDLAMPVMSGLDLMRHVKRKYPHIWIAVLTFHQDFELVQEALRLGAIDYIAKAELEQATMEEVLGAIHNRIQSDVSARQALKQAEYEAEPPESGDSAAWRIFMALEANVSELEWMSLGYVKEHELQQLHYGIWGMRVNPQQLNDEASAMELMHGNADGRWIVLHLTELQNAQRQHIRKELLAYKEHHLFYEFERGREAYAYTFHELTRRRVQWLDVEAEQLRESLSRLSWVTDDEEFERLVSEADRLRLPQSRLEAIFHTAKVHWLRLIPPERSGEIDIPGPLHYWCDWRDWLSHIRASVFTELRRPAYTEEIRSGIMNAVHYMNEHMTEDLRHQQLADIANMSKGYFSKCFKGLIGKTFQEYIRDARLEQAMLLLRQTDKSIVQIALQCGYPNEKYFSRIFRDQVGMLPREYRSRNGERT